MIDFQSTAYTSLDFVWFRSDNRISFRGCWYLHCLLPHLDHFHFSLILRPRSFISKSIDLCGAANLFFLLFCPPSLYWSTLITPQVLRLHIRYPFPRILWNSKLSHWPHLQSISFWGWHITCNVLGARLCAFRWICCQTPRYRADDW